MSIRSRSIDLEAAGTVAGEGHATRAPRPRVPPEANESTAETKEGEARSFDEYAAIAAALQPYIEAARTGDGKGMREVWFDHARVVGSLDGNPVNLSADEFCKLIDGVGGSPGVKSRVVSIDYAGRAAAARVEFIDWGGARYTDFFVLYKHDGRWRISGKVYDSHTRN